MRAAAERATPGGGFVALVLAGERAEGDPLARELGVACKALLPVGERPMVMRVLDALAAARSVDAVVVCGDPGRLRECAELRAREDAGDVRLVTSRTSPCTSVTAVLDELDDDRRVLVTTADHALLTAEMVDRFAADAAGSGADVAVGLARHDVVERAFPGVHRTVYRVRDGGFCGCNLFTFLTPRARRAADFWRRIETSRKRPLAVARMFGVGTLLLFALRRLTLAGALARMSRRIGVEARAVEVPFADAAVDVDTRADWDLVCARVGGAAS